MRKYSATELEDFLRRVDQELSTDCVIVVIGGAAIALRYETHHVTSDLDVWSVSLELKVETATDTEFWQAVERANQGAAQRVPVGKATIAEPPINFEDRLTTHAIKGLSRLTVKLPEAHDLVLLKVARGEAHDLDAIEDIHRSHPLSLDTLLERYEETKPQVIGSPENHRLNFLAAVARLFGAEKAEEVDRRTKGRPPPVSP